MVVAIGFSIGKDRAKQKLCYLNPNPDRSGLAGSGPRPSSNGSKKDPVAYDSKSE